MNEPIITSSIMENFRLHLVDNEKSPATIEKYLRDVRRFAARIKGQALNRQAVLAYKAALAAEYAVTSANSMLASLNAFLRFAGWGDLCVKQFKLQRSAYTPAEKELSREEYERLVNTARERGNERLSLMIQTICATGIRVSELQHITAESLQRGEARVRCKGKTRVIFLVKELRQRLLGYAKRSGIAAGPIFVTRNGTPVSRTAIWRDMKALCRQAGVLPQKVFPHNLRHLFARTFYGIEKDIAKLADILGHSSINTTRIYIATTGEEHRQRMERLHLLVKQTKKPSPKQMACLHNKHYVD